MTAHLYINSRGQEITRHSYSSGSVFKYCAARYKLSRIDGWREKGQYARTKFGISMEEAIQAYHENNLDLAVTLQVFGFGPKPKSDSPEDIAAAKSKGWEAHRHNTEMKYSATEGDWETLRLTGFEMLALYHLRLPLFPISRDSAPRFQVNLKKEVFPNSRLAGIEITSYLDMIATSKATLSGRLLVDIKCMATPLNTTPGILRLDEQLKVYSWLSDVPDVGFLWFQKCGRGMEKNSHVFLLENVADMKAGGNAWVARYDEADSEFDEDVVWLVDSEEKIQLMDAAQGRKNGKLEQTKDAKARKEEWLAANAHKVNPSAVTKQRVNFATATMTPADRQEAADIIGNDIIRIVAANENNSWHKEGGIRYPNDKCTKCEMRGICLNNEQLRDALVERADDTFDTHEDDGE